MTAADLARPETPRGVVSCLREGATTLGADPFGILLPVAGVLLLQVLGATAVREAWSSGPPVAAAQAFGVALAIRTVLGAPLRSRWIAAAARANGLPAAPWGRPLPLLAVELVVRPLTVCAALVPLLPLGVGAAALAERGWFGSASVVAAAAVLGAVLAALLVRAAFGHAAFEVVVGGRSGPVALYRSAVRIPREILPVALLILVGDWATGLGGLLCGAGALPGYPLADLAVLQRWRATVRGTP